jgi:hypothetical protein
MSNLTNEINTDITALLTNLFDAFDINNDNQLDLTEFRNLVSFIFITHETSLHANEIQSDEQLNTLMNSYHDSLSTEKTKELSIFFPSKQTLSLDDFLNTLMINPIPNNWEKLAFFKELCIECYTNQQIFDHIANKFNQVLHTAIPVSNEQQNVPSNTTSSNVTLETYNNNPPINLSISELAMDFIEGEKNIIDFIKEDKNNCAFYYSQNWYLSNKDQIKEMMDISKPDNQVVYRCKSDSGLIGPDNVDETKMYFRLRNIGLPLDFVPIEYMNAFINSTNPYFIIEVTNDKLITVVSNNVLKHRADWTGAAHCQEDQGGKIYILKILNPVIQQGGKKHRKTRKNKKIGKKGKKTRSKK